MGVTLVSKGPGLLPALYLNSTFLPAKGGILVARSAGLEPATFSVRSQDTCVYSGLRLLQNCLPKPNYRSRCLQLFTWVTVKSLSTTLASNDQPAAFRCGKGSSSRKLISGTEIHWKSGFREASEKHPTRILGE